MNRAASRRLQVGLRGAVRLIELFACFLVLPTLVYVGVLPSRYRIALLITAAVVLVGVVLWAGVTKERLGLGRRGRRGFWPTVWLGVKWGAIPLLTLVGWHLLEGRPIYAPPRGSNAIMLMICLFYPISATAQEFIYRSYFFWRYEGVLPTAVLIPLNALLFGYVHIIYGHWMSVVLTTVGGLAFAYMYERHRSLPGVAAVHAAAGLLAFATGWGWLFYVEAR